MDIVMIEIRAAEGGTDAKLLVEEQLAMYTRLAARRRL
jgi:protein subunit release factor A